MPAEGAGGVSKMDEPTADLSQIAADLSKLPKVESKGGMTFSGTTASISVPNDSASLSYSDLKDIMAKMYGVPPHMVGYTHTFTPGPDHNNDVVEALWNASCALAKQIKLDGITKPLTIYAPLPPDQKYLVNDAPNLAALTIKKLVVTVKLEK